MWVLVPPAILICGALFLRLVVGPAWEKLPTDYGSSVVLESDSSFRQTLDAALTTFHQKGRRVDQVLSSTDGVAIVQSHVDWSNDSGEVNYQTTGLYGVDRRTRKNVAGYGDVSRSGQFLFPPRLEGSIDEVWDPYYSGPRHLAFDRSEVVDGVTVAVYRFTVAGLDETSAYEFLPDVSERYGVGTDGEGYLWIEPVSGILVDMLDRGHSYFVDPATKKFAGDFSVWQARYTAQSRSDLLSLAAEARLRILATESWLPIGGIGLAVAWLGIGALRLRRGKPASVG